MEALIIVDIQNDFNEAGVLPIKSMSNIIDVINSLLPYFEIIVFTQDWHPNNHCSFNTNGGIFVPHCIADTDGAKIDNRINRNLNTKQRVYYIKKGISKDTECFSAFYDTPQISTGLTHLLQSQNVEEVYVCGVAGEYCIRATLLDAVKDNFLTNLVRDGTGFITTNEEEIKGYYYYFTKKKVWVVDSSDIKNFIDLIN